MSKALKKNHLLTNLFPFLSWIPRTNAETVWADLIAGATVALVLIPQSMAYAQLAGLPPVYGLYAALLPALIGVLWGSSAYLGTGPVAMTSLLTMATLIPFGSGDPDFVGSERYIELAILLAFMVGVVRFLVGVLRLTFLVNFLSQPVVRGFINAGALIIASSQVGKIFGVSMTRSDFYLRDLWEMALTIPQATHLPTLVIGTTALVLLWALKKYAPKVPSALVVVVLGSLAVKFLGLADPRALDPTFSGMIDPGARFVKVVGIIPAGLPPLQAPAFDLDMMIKMIPGAFVVMFIGFMEVTSVLKALAPKSKEKVNLNQELIGQGLSALVGSFSSCYPTSGSFSRTALNFASGGRTGLSSVFVAIIVFFSLLYLTPYLIYLPQAVLAAIIIMAVMGLIDFKAVVQASKVSKLDATASMVTFLSALLFAPAIVNGILVGGLLAIVFHLFRTMSPAVTIFSDFEEEGDQMIPKIVPSATNPQMRFDGRLYFANVAYFETSVLKVFEQHPQAKRVIVICEGINDMDASAEATLREMLNNLKTEGKEVIFVGLKPQVLEVVQRSGLDQVIGPHNLLPDQEAVNKRLKAG